MHLKSWKEKVNSAITDTKWEGETTFSKNI